MKLDGVDFCHQYLNIYSSVIAIACDQAGRISDCNQAFLRLIDKETAPLGKNISDYLVIPKSSDASPNDVDMPVRISVRLKAASTTYRCNATVFSSNGGKLFFCERPILVQSDFVANMAELNQELASLTWELNQKNRLIEIANQVLAQEKKELEESERRYRQLLEDANVIILIFDVEGFILYINEHGRYFFQYDNEELVGQSLFETIVPQIDSTGKQSQTIFAEEMARLESFQRYTGENRTRLGKSLWIDWTVRRLPKRTGEKDQYMAIGIDVTAQRRIRNEEKLGYARRQRSELFNGAIAKQLSNEELTAAAREIGIEIADKFFCVFSLSKGLNLNPALLDSAIDTQHLLNRLTDCLCNYEGGIAWQASDGIALLLPDFNDYSASTKRTAVLRAGKALERLKQFAPSLSFHCGVSHSTGKMTTLAEIYEQSVATAKFGPTLLGLRQVYHWQELGAYQFIIRDIHSAMASRFVEDQLGPILSIRNKEKQQELLRTLEEIVTLESVETLGKRLNIVSKTVRYRMRNLEKLLGTSLNSMETLSSLSLALKILAIAQTHSR